MKKTNVLFFAFFIAFLSHAQAPSGYYSSATGSGYTLKTQLYNIIKNHTDRGYSGLWTTYSTSDRDHQNENDNTIFDLYSEIQNGKDPYNYSYGTNQCGTYSGEGSCYNREHMIPQSVFNSSSPMVSDAHFITPTDGYVNGIRSNYPHGKVATASRTTRNGSKLGTSAVSGYTGTVFEPVDAFKGDIARMYFYFATRYENTVSNYNYAMFNRTSNQVFTTAFLNMLLAWHAQDPVSSREIERNNAIYARQGNRNPFIDNPNYVNAIWGGTSGGSTGGGSTGGGSTTTRSDLYLSEYIEGSSNNKALEIKNETGTSKSLSSYSLKKQTNGAGSWSSALTLSGTLANNGKFVIVNSSISSTCYSTSNANLSTSSTVLTFNGNDAVGLFKNGVLIDIIGNFNGGSANFAADVTLRRKATATAPKTSYSSSDWDVYTTNTCGGLGNRMSEEIAEKEDVIDIKAYPNPNKGTFTIDFNTNNAVFLVEIYSTLGQKIYQKSVEKQNQLQIDNLQKGIYYVMISNVDTHKMLRIIVE
ncbi:T9SS type A sorting domain-containing protein [Flavobacterium sp. TP390]|uniref:T9SS type A sorting domain-containing protein n=1 Tax=Flavobacterium profundi TaxID=1774945 RepID=A0A6I4IV45_9FLAO|nr:endonuclease [Flavobacterium profundi]MVO10710.1 T9SS type A sorting domain-containing protein [Flavobacterium profundi]